MQTCKERHVPRALFHGNVCMYLHLHAFLRLHANFMLIGNKTINVVTWPKLERGSFSSNPLDDLAETFKVGVIITIDNNNAAV